jgi:hypothetical protein
MRYPKTTVVVDAELPMLLVLGTKPTRSLTLNGLPLRRPAFESGTLSVAVFWALLSLR